MKTDRELLELAARAAGIVGVWHEHGEAMRIETNPGHEWWNPLTDDGDALRLACQLQFDIALGHKGATVTLYGGQLAQEFCHKDSGEDNAATRRAITRAAAAIGESMP